DKKSQEKALLRDLARGKLTVLMKGSKVKGEFTLVKTGRRGENAWLLMKGNDKHASAKDVTLKEKSVVSGKTLEQVAKTSDNIYGQPAKKRKEAKADTAVKKKAV